MALRPGRYIAHYIGLARDGKPIYAAYCCVPDVQSDIPSFVSVSDSVSGSWSWDSHPSYPSYPQSGGSIPSGLSCTECLSRFCVVRDETGRIVDIYYYTDDGSYVRVPDCGYYGSAPISGGSGPMSVPSSGGSSSGSSDAGNSWFYYDSAGFSGGGGGGGGGGTSWPYYYGTGIGSDSGWFYYGSDAGGSSGSDWSYSGGDGGIGLSWPGPDGGGSVPGYYEEQF